MHALLQVMKPRFHVVRERCEPRLLRLPQAAEVAIALTTAKFSCDLQFCLLDKVGQHVFWGPALINGTSRDRSPATC